MKLNFNKENVDRRRIKRENKSGEKSLRLKRKQNKKERVKNQSDSLF